MRTLLSRATQIDPSFNVGLGLVVILAVVEIFAATGHITEALEFGTVTDFAYTLEASESQHAISANHTPHTISIVVPKPLAHQWTSTDRVGISGAQPLAGGRELQILIEKDFKCIHKSAEGDGDAYPNPLASTPGPQ